MKTQIWALAVAAAIIFAPSAEAAFVAVLTGDGGVGNGTAFTTVSTEDYTTIGWSFIPNAPINITSLGRWDEGEGTGGTIPEEGDGFLFDEGREVGIWNSSGTLLASAVVGNSAGKFDDGIDNGGNFRFVGIPFLALEAGEEYTIGSLQVASDGDDFRGSVSATTVDPLISVGSFFPHTSALVTGGAPALANPTTTPAGGPAGFFGPNFTFAPIPEPTSLITCLGLAVCGVAIGRRRRRR